MLDPRRKEVSVNLVKKLCDGLDMTLGEFFGTQKFDELEQEAIDALVAYIKNFKLFLAVTVNGRNYVLVHGRVPYGQHRRRI